MLEKPYIEYTPAPGDPGAYADRQVADTLARNRAGAVAVATEIIDDDNESWMKAGACKDVHPSVMFPSDGVGVKVAQDICRVCPVKDICLEFALKDRIDHGIWGGVSERERRRILRQRRLDAI